MLADRRALWAVGVGAMGDLGWGELRPVDQNCRVDQGEQTCLVNAATCQAKERQLS